MGRSLTAEIAPQESPFYDELIQAYRNPKPARKDRSLAFGVSPDSVIAIALLEIGKIVLQGIWSAAQPMLSGLLQDSASELRAQLGEKIKDWIKSRFKKPLPVKIKPEEAEKILAAVKESAALQGLDETHISEVTKMISQALVRPV